MRSTPQRAARAHDPIDATPLSPDYLRCRLSLRPPPGPIEAGVATTSILKIYSIII